MLDLRGNPDLFGRTLMVTVSAFADEIAAAASLVMGQADEAQPVVLVRGLSWKLPGDQRRRAGAAGNRGPVPLGRLRSFSSAAQATARMLFGCSVTVRDVVAPGKVTSTAPVTLSMSITWPGWKSPKVTQ